MEKNLLKAYAWSVTQCSIKTTNETEETKLLVFET